MKNALPASDLFVLLDRAFRRKARECSQCAFTLPFHLPKRSGSRANWSVVAGAACSERCRLILEELVAEHQSAYELAANDSPTPSKGAKGRAH